MEMLELQAFTEMFGLRLDKALSLIPQIQTRSRASQLIEAGHVLVNAKIAKSSLIIKKDDHIVIQLIPQPAQEKLIPLDLKLDVIFEDADLLVINKPSGLVVHPAAGHQQDTLVNALVAHTHDLSMKFGEERPGIVHRLDKETSGLIVVAKNDLTHEALAQQFKERSTHRIYFAVCLGHSRQLEGKVQSYLSRHPFDRKKYASLTDENKKIIQQKDDSIVGGKWAVTNFHVLCRKHGLSYCKLKLETGRTHQIRVHLSEQGIPIAGDTLYGSDKKVKAVEAKYIQQQIRSLNRFLLHAAELGFTHPKTQEWMQFSVDWPQPDLELITSWGLR